MDEHPLSFADHLVPSLVSSARAIYDASLEKETRSSYHTAVFGPNGYQTTLLNLGHRANDIWPANPSLIGLWLAWLHAQNLASGTSYLSGLRDAHLHRKLPWLPTSHDAAAVAKLRKGYNRLLTPKANASSRIFAITPLHIRAFATSPQITEAQNGVNFLAASACASYGSNRGGELFSQASAVEARSKIIRRKHLIFRPQAGGMSIMLPRDKTHGSTPIEVWLPELTDDPTCPVALVRSMIAEREDEHGPDSPESPLFQASDGSHIDFNTLKKWSIEAIYRVGSFIPENETIGLKSWRRGHTTAFERISPARYEGLKQAGRWKGHSHQAYSKQGLSQHIFAMAADSAATIDALGPDEHIRLAIDPDGPFYFHDHEHKPPLLFAPLVIPPDSDWAKQRNDPSQRITIADIQSVIKHKRFVRLPGHGDSAKRKRRSSISPPRSRRHPRSSKRAKRSSISP
jgi:hypothetical protein